MINFKVLFVSVLLSYFIVSCSSDLPYEYLLQGETMGTSYNVKLIFREPKTPTELKSIKADVDSALHIIDSLMSTYRKDSEVSQINRLELGRSLNISTETVEVLTSAKRISQVTNGYFDITVGPLVNLWGFGPNFRSDAMPKKLEIAAAQERVNWQAIVLDQSSVLKTQLVSIDLSAIAKGYAVDKVVEVLLLANVKNFLVEVGGEISVSGKNKRNNDWVLGIEQPNIIDRKAYTTLSLSGQSLATSGDYRNYYEKNGQRFSHTIDPKTAYPVKHKLASVSVISKTCMEADAMATALMAMGEHKGYEFALKRGVNAYFIYRENGEYNFKYTPGFKPFLNIL